MRYCTVFPRVHFLPKIAIALLIPALIACSPGTKSGANAPPAPIEDPAAIASIIPGASLTIGDVETSLIFVVRPSQLLVTDPNIDVNEEENFKKKLVKTTVDFKTPPGDRLPFVYAIASKRNYEEHVVQVKGTVKADGKSIRTFSGVFGKDAMNNPIGGDVLLRDHFDSLPDTMLIMAEAELVFFKNTSENSVTVDTPAPDDAERVTIYSNTVRVNF